MPPLAGRSVSRSGTITELMSIRRAYWILPVRRACALAFLGLAQPLAVASNSPGAGVSATPRLAVSADQALRISWSEGPEYPMGIQDSACGMVAGRLVSAGGFSRHTKGIAKQIPQAFGGAESGFTNLTFAYDPKRPKDGWARIAD